VRDNRRPEKKIVYSTSKDQPEEFAKGTRKPRPSSTTGGKKPTVRRLRPE
jgi:hypothetical protein